jgi:hypothetical protein
LIKQILIKWTLDRKNHPSRYTYFIANDRISHHQWAILGIREMKECTQDNLNHNIQFTSDYSIRIYTSGCYYLDNNNNWQSDGLMVNRKKTIILFLIFISIRWDQKQMNVLHNVIQHI